MTYKFYSGNKGEGEGVLCFANQWEETMWLRERVEGKEVQSDYTYLVFAVEVVGFLDYIDDFPDHPGIVS